MKAWEVSHYGGWSSLVHAETAGKAKAKVLRIYDNGDMEYTDFGAYRLPEFDDKAIQFEVNDCDCDICKKG